MHVHAVYVLFLLLFILTIKKDNSPVMKRLKRSCQHVAEVRAIGNLNVNLIFLLNHLTCAEGDYHIALL